MATGDQFLEWKEQFVSKERGNRVVHYYLKDSSGESVLAVVGTERSVRHMFYVVAEEFLNAYGVEASVHTGFRWRSRREVVNWLNSMLSKQHRQDDCLRSPKDDPIFAVDVQPTQMREPKGHLARYLRGNPSDIVWSGVSWSCGKQLKHFPAFCRNGISIAIQSFVYVMAEKENRYLAYLEDMYEDRKGHKKVKVRWFHHNREVRGVVSLRNPHPKEVFITPYAQVISAECVDGPAIVLTREHFEKCMSVFPSDLLAQAHFCFRQFKGNQVKPFKLSKLRGYTDQPIFSCFSPDFFEDEELSSGDEVKVGVKRAVSGNEHLPISKKFSRDELKYSLSGGLDNQKHAEGLFYPARMFIINDKIEFLCQDSGIRGCWFRCTVLEISRRQIKIRYDDVEDEDGCGNLEEWIPAFRQASPDKFGMRCPGRATVRPSVTREPLDVVLDVGTPVDAWWSDGWWEGVIARNNNSCNDIYQVYIPSENLFLNIDKEKLRISRDWLGDRWMDVEGNLDVLPGLSATISLDSKVSVSSAITKETKSDGSPVSRLKAPSDVRLSVVYENQVTGCANTDLQQVVQEEDSELPHVAKEKAIDLQQMVKEEDSDLQQVVKEEDGDLQQVVKEEDSGHADRKVDDCDMRNHDGHADRKVDDSDMRNHDDAPNLVDSDLSLAKSENSDDNEGKLDEEKLAEFETSELQQCEAEAMEVAA